MAYSTGGLNTMCSSFFPRLRKDLGPYLVDKTMLIENIVVSSRLTGHVDLVLRPRRCGKSTMLQMLNSFFSIPRNGGPEPSQLFAGLYIASKHDICQEYMGKYAVIDCDFKNIVGDSWEQMFISFRRMVMYLYKEWYQYLKDSLDSEEEAYFNSIRLNTAEKLEWMDSLTRLSKLLRKKSGRPVMVFIDEYEAPINRAYECNFFSEANGFFGRGHGVLPALLKGNIDVDYAILAGVTPTAKSGWYSGLNNLKMHALHTINSPFTGMLMFTEMEVDRLRTLAASKLNLADLKARYNSYLSGGLISVYNPVSVMSALTDETIEDYWVATGEYPLLNREFPDDSSCIKVIENLLTWGEVEFDLAEDVTYSSLTLSKDAMLTLLYYGGYLTMTVNYQFKIPNLEVMTDWSRWIVGHAEFSDDILKTCVEVGKARGALSRKTPEKFYHAKFWGLMQSLRRKGWEVSIEPRAGAGYTDIRLCHKRKHMAVLIELKSSEKQGDMEMDAKKALKQIVEMNYRNPEGLPDIHTLREYGIAGFDLSSYVEGRYLELDGQKQWVEKSDPMMSRMSVV